MFDLDDPVGAGEDQGDPGSPATRTPVRVRHVLLRGALVTLAAAVFLTLLLEASTLGLFSIRWLRDQFFVGVSFYADTLVVWLLLLFLWAVIGRLWWSIGLLTAFVVMIGMANLTKLQLREEPLYPSDVDFLSEPGFLTTQVSTPTLVLGLLALAGIVVGSVLLGRRIARRYPRPTWRTLRRKHAVAVLALRVFVLVIAAGLLFQTTRFNQPGNLWRQLYEAKGEHWRYWNQKTNYRSNGFVGGFLYNMPIDAMARPQGYDEAAMQQLATTYAGVADGINETRTGSLDDVNVVLVLSESFSDPMALEGFELQRDPMPRLRETMAETASGTMLAQLYGGGTANMEFETLTGQSLALFRPQLISPYQMLVSDYEEYPSAVGWFKHHGHKPIAIHPYKVGMYKREQVYETFGFEEFIHDTTMQSHATIDHNPFIKDEAAFDEVLTQIQRNDEPLMVNLVTMQNHIPVGGHYDDPIQVTGIDRDQGRKIGQYARGLEYTDAALDSFLGELEQSDEKTVVLFYGDHLPGIYDGEVKHDNPGTALYKTPFFVWSNIPGANQPRPQPLTNAAFFLDVLYEVADAPVPPYLALLHQVHQRIGAMQQGRLITREGEKVDESSLDATTQQLLADLRLVQYDFSIGKRYAVDEMWPGATG